MGTDTPLASLVAIDCQALQMEPCWLHNNQWPTLPKALLSLPDRSTDTHASTLLCWFVKHEECGVEEKHRRRVSCSACSKVRCRGRGVSHAAAQTLPESARGGHPAVAPPVVSRDGDACSQTRAKTTKTGFSNPNRPDPEFLINSDQTQRS